MVGRIEDDDDEDGRTNPILIIIIPIPNTLIRTLNLNSTVIHNLDCDLNLNP